MVKSWRGAREKNQDYALQIWIWIEQSHRYELILFWTYLYLLFIFLFSSCSGPLSSNIFELQPSASICSSYSLPLHNFYWFASFHVVTFSLFYWLFNSFIFYSPSPSLSLSLSLCVSLSLSLFLTLTLSLYLSLYFFSGPASVLDLEICFISRFLLFLYLGSSSSI